MLITNKFFRSNGYFRDSFIFLCFSILSAAINYIYYPVIARLLPASSFGAAQSLIAILLQISAVFSGLSLVTVYIVKNLGENKTKNAIEVLQRTTTWLFILLVAMLMIGQSAILKFLHIDSSLHLMIVGLDLVSTIPFIIIFGYLQAHTRFIAAGSLQLTVFSFKLVLGGLATWKLGVSGALLGVALGNIFGLTLFWLVCKKFSIPTWSHSILSSISFPTIKSIRSIGLPLSKVGSVFITNVIVMLLISFDILAARHYFSNDLSGLYAGASTISNAIVFASIPLVGVLLPNLDIHNFRLSISPFIKTSCLLLIGSVAAILAMSIMPNFILSFFGEEYKYFSSLLWRFGVMMSLVSFIVLVFQVNAFYKPKASALTIVAGACLLLYMIINNHSDPQSLIGGITLSFYIILTSGIILLTNTYLKGGSNDT